MATSKPAVTNEAIKALAQNLASMSGEDAVRAWLEGIKLEEHFDVVISLGYTSIEAITNTDDEQQKMITGELKLPLGPKKRFLRAIAVLKEARDAPTDEPPASAD